MKAVLYGLVGCFVVIALGVFAFLQHPKFGTLPEGDRLAAIQRSPNYVDGEFRNQIETPLFTEGQSFAQVLMKNVRAPGERLRPDSMIPTATVDFHGLDSAEDMVIWLGHSSYYMQLSGLRILIDPVFSEAASPVPIANRAFAGTTVFSAEDMPAIDYLLISHDHWDHLDYPSVISLKPKVRKVVVGLGLGAYFQNWGYDPSRIIEGDWNDSVKLSEAVTLHVIPARHYSGRALKRNQTLWVGFILQTPQRRILFSGDSGYGPHFAELGKRFKGFDLVALDQGQYDARWAYIHMTPEQAAQAADELGAKSLLPAHVGRFSLARHAWDEPFQRISVASAGRRYRLVTPMIGEPVRLSDVNTQSFSSWWLASNTVNVENFPTQKPAQKKRQQTGENTMELASPVVLTQQGKVEGETVGNLRLFRGIPFAAPPVGEVRWRPPATPKSWSGIRQTKAFAPACFQAPNELMNVPSQPVSEDCLYLNVWTPAKSAEDALPVLVWIHGGGFSFGSTAMPLFDGTALANKGVVFVSTAYRLGPFGFLAHPELSKESPHGVSGNYGLLDQIAALKWVQQNIRAFGGNPDQVTIMGESAGGMSVSALVQSPLAKGLFKGAIAQSGALMTSAGMVRSLKDAGKSGAQFAHSLGASTLQELRALPAEKIWQASGVGMPFNRRESWPIMDGYVLPGNPIELYEQQRFNATPVLIGNNEREGDLFPHASNLDEYKRSVQQNYGPLAKQILAAYPATDDASAKASASALLTDSLFGIQNWTWARLQSRFIHAPVYYYVFAHDPPDYPGSIPGPIHGAELPYVFGTPESRPYHWSGVDQAMSQRLMTYWTNFVKHGNPNGSGVPEWPAFTPTTPEVMVFKDGHGEIEPVPHQERMSVLDPLKSKVIE